MCVRSTFCRRFRSATENLPSPPTFPVCRLFPTLTTREHRFTRFRSHDFRVWTGESEFNPIVEPRSFVPTNIESFYAPAYGIWYQKGGLYGNPKALQGGQAPPKNSPLRRAQEILERARQTPTRAGQVAIFGEALDIAAENVWSISIATPPQLAVVKNGFRNVPRNVIYGASYNTPSNGRNSRR